MYEIENQYLKIAVCSKGAELKSIFDKEMEKEILWKGDPAFWDRSSPVLFPNVGRHHENKCLYKGHMYDTVQHGFARDMEFECMEAEADHLSFQIKDTEETRSYFPFAFFLKITYKLTERKLEVFWEVNNQDKETMYFTIGGHPGFNVPVLEGTQQTDYKLLFKNRKSLEYCLVYGNTGTADSSKTYDLNLEPSGEYEGCAITEHMFDKDALIFDNSQIACVGIAYPDGSPYVMMECTGFTNFGIWSKPGAPFVCLEPWMGRCDDYGFNDEITEKPDIIKLEPEKVFYQSYTLTIYNK